MARKTTVTPVTIADTSTAPQPIQLTGDRLELRQRLHNQYALSDADSHLLQTACEALERAAELSALVSKEGPTFVDRFGSRRKNPACDLERDFKNLGGRLLNQLASRLEGGA